MITLATVKEFQSVIASDYGYELTDGEAKEILSDLVGFFDVLAQINHEDNQSDGGRQ